MSNNGEVPSCISEKGFYICPTFPTLHFQREISVKASKGG